MLKKECYVNATLQSAVINLKRSSVDRYLANRSFSVSPCDANLKELLLTS